MTKTSNFSQYYRHVASVCFRRFHFREISRLHISDYPCLTILSRFSPLLSSVRAVRISISVRLKSLARMRHIVGDSLSGPTATRLLRMHRGRDDIMRLQWRKCNGNCIPSFPPVPPSVFTCASHRPLFFLWPTLHLTLIELWPYSITRRKVIVISFS